MFCKWCGNDLKLTDKACPACGRQTPPMSDCGGFYNLKHEKQASPMSPGVLHGLPPVTSAANPPYPPVEQPIPTRANRKRTTRHLAILSICLAFTLVTIIFMVVLAISMNNQLAELKKQLADAPGSSLADPSNESSPNPIDSTPLVDPTSEAEATEEPDTDASEKTQAHTFSINEEIRLSDATVVQSAYDFENYTKSVTVRNRCERSPLGNTFTISYTLDHAETVNLKVSYTQSAEDALILIASCENTIPIFQHANATYEWQYRGKQNVWLSVSENTAADPTEDGREICCSQEWLKTVSSEGAPVALRCCIRIQSESDDLMEIILSCISVADDGTILTNRENTN